MEGALAGNKIRKSLSARRAWIEIGRTLRQLQSALVALRKESVDRNKIGIAAIDGIIESLSARRAWIEISTTRTRMPIGCVALRKESVDRNREQFKYVVQCRSRSPQGERG